MKKQGVYWVSIILTYVVILTSITLYLATTPLPIIALVDICIYHMTEQGVKKW